MKIIILLCAAALLASSSPTALSESMARVGDVVGVVECISKKASSLAEETPHSFCGEEVVENAQCFSNFNSLNLCLLNNKCFINKDEPSVPLPSHRSRPSAGTAGKMYPTPPTSSYNSRKISQAAPKNSSECSPCSSSHSPCCCDV